MKEVTKKEFFSALMNEKRDTEAEIIGDFKTELECIRKFKQSRQVFGKVITKFEAGVYPHKETFYLSI